MDFWTGLEVPLWFIVALPFNVASVKYLHVDDVDSGVE
jgi:hypothetical protein